MTGCSTDAVRWKRVAVYKYGAWPYALGATAIRRAILCNTLSLYIRVCVWALKIILDEIIFCIAVEEGVDYEIGSIGLHTAFHMDEGLALLYAE